MNSSKVSIELLKECENNYLSCFTEATDFESYILYRDEHIKDMYTHNFIFVKDGLDNEGALRLVKEKLQENSEKSFVNFLFSPDYHLDWEGFKALDVELSFLLYMAIETEKLKVPKINEECIVKIAENEKMLFDGVICEIKGDDADFSFLYRCNIRKKDVFLKNNDRLFNFIAYIDNVPVGKCEVYMSNELLRIESFMVLDCFRNKGIGSSILNAIKEFAFQKGINLIYLMAEEDDTPKEMYSRMGFEIIGRECWMLWRRGI